MIDINKIYNEDCLAGLKKLPDNCVNCCVTSPPYYGLRDYGHSEQLGLEKTPELYVEKMVEVFKEVKRVLKKDGTLWLNIGDSYAAASKQRSHEQVCRKSNLTGGKANQIACKDQPNKITGNLKAKDLIGIPWMLAFALRADGWYLRQDIIWNKPNPMPESVTDRCTKSHEYVFLLSNSAKYYYNQEAIKTIILENKGPQVFGGNKARIAQLGTGDPRNGHRSDTNSQWGKTWAPKAYKHRGTGDKKLTGRSGNFDAEGNLIGNGFANKKSVWTIATNPFPEAHFATFPEELIVDMIKAGCPENGIVLDPFMGAGTTALVARKLNRNFIGFELNADYVRIAEKRLRKELGIFHHDNF